MKNYIISILAVMVSLLLSHDLLAQQYASQNHGSGRRSGLSNVFKGKSDLGLGMYYHVDHSTFDELPFDDGDVSYMVAWNIHDKGAYWQVAFDYASHISTTNYQESVTNAPLGGTIDVAMTPQVNLIMQDGSYRTAVGMLKTYIRDSDGNSDWTDLYWQLQLGMNIPAGGFNVDIFASYVFESWSDVSDFDSDDLEYGVWVNFSF